MRPYKIILSGGGTGGHIYPAIAIANECSSRWPDCEILFVGASDRMEMQKVPAAGYEIKGLWISGLQRRITLDNLVFPFKVVKSLWDARSIIRDFRPDIAIGTGGYASGPLLYAASLQGIPTLIQEQNSYAGITNKLLGKKVDRICVAYDGMQKFFPTDKIIKTGNPVRQDILQIDSKRKEAFIYFGLEPGKKTLLVLGGSLGAKRINNLIADHFRELLHDVQIIWQCGSAHYDRYKQLEEAGMQVKKFINRMDLAYAAADFIISRAGAGSISELAVVGKPVILIPSPHVAEDHQKHNAQAVVEKDAAIMIEEKNLDAMFAVTWQQLMNSSDLQDKLAGNLKRTALPQATNNIVNHAKELIDG